MEVEVSNCNKDTTPAFPQTITFSPNGEAVTAGMYYAEGPGMTLRDWFAGQAMAGLAAQHHLLLENMQLVQEFGTIGIDNLQANQAYRLADAMIAERSK
jgi:hypothetical protein